jgi:hypothetical protein
MIKELKSLQIRAGLLSTMPTLLIGQLYLATDTNDLYIGTATGNKLVGLDPMAQNQFGGGIGSVWISVGQPALANSFFNPNTTSQPYEALRTMEVLGGLNVVPRTSNGYANLNIFFDRLTDGSGGIGNINWAEKINSGPNAGRFIKRYSLGNDVFQPLVQSAVGDMINPQFILLNITDVDKNDGTSYDMLFFQSYKQDKGGGNFLYPGQWAVNTSIVPDSVFTISVFEEAGLYTQPASLVILNLHRRSQANPFLRFTEGTSDTAWFNATHNQWRWYGPGGTYAQGVYGISFELSDNNARVDWTAKTVNTYVSDKFAIGSLNNDLTVDLYVATGADKSIIVNLSPSGSGNSFLLAGTGAFVIGAKSSADVIIRTNNTDRLTINGSGVATFSGEVRIGNTVNIVSPTNPNRTIEMVIGGTTYYLHAKTTND